MSDAEKEVQNRRDQRINRGFIRVNLMQAITVASILVSVYLWLTSRDEKQIIDGTSLSAQISSLRQDFKSFRAQDSIIRHQQRFMDSVAMANRFTDLKRVIEADINRRLAATEKRLYGLESRVRGGFVQEIKKSDGTIATKSVNK